MNTVQMLLDLTDTQKQGIKNMLCVECENWLPFLYVRRYPFQDRKIKLQMHWSENLDVELITNGWFVFATKLLEQEINEHYESLLHATT